MNKGILGLGAYDFREIFDKNIFYIDKTYFLKEWLDNGDVVTLITRPRRFGKTLTMSMVEHFLSDRYKEDRAIFEKLYIGQCECSEKYMALQGSAPVIFLSFAGVKGECFENTFRRIESIIAELFIKHDYILNSEHLSDIEKSYFLKIVSKQGDEVDIERAVLNLSVYLEKVSGTKPYILLDEYDTPLQNAYVKGYWDKITSFIMSFFVNTFKVNNSLNRAIITGITRVSKESIFSDLNNLRVITTTSKSYASCFGFTEEEVFWALDNYNLSDEKENVKKYYNGFLMGENISVYNPWSIVNYLANRKYDNYWANTSSNALINETIMKSSPKVKQDMECLMKGGIIYTSIDEDVVYKDLDDTPDAGIWSLMLASGYLKVSEQVNDIYGLQITNYEVEQMFKKMFKNWFSKSSMNYNNFILAMLNGLPKKMEKYLNTVSMDMFSYFDTGSRSSNRTEPERFYHGFALGLMVDMMDKYVVDSNRESGLGRYDICVKPRDLKDAGVIIEFKAYDEYEDKDLLASAKDALKQIEDKQYEQMLVTEGITKIYKYGIAFKGKQCVVEMG